MTEEFRNIGKPSEIEGGDLEVGGMTGDPELLRINPPEIVSKLFIF